MRDSIFYSLFLAVIFNLIACVSYDDYDTSTAEGTYKLASKLEEDSRFEESLLQYQDLKNRFPYSQFSTEAELRVAEIHYKRDAFAEAQSAYQLFKELHPKHPKIDYVTFKIAESIFMQLPSTIDRDLTLAPQAIRFYRMVLSDYPQSGFAAKARDRVNETLRKLADKEIYIADFYYRTENYVSAIVRYEQYMKAYPHHGKVPHALLRAGLAAEKIGDGEKKSKYLREVIAKFPQSDQAKKAQREL